MITGRVNLDIRKPLSYGDTWWVEYFVEITIISPNERDNVGGLDDYMDWRHQIQNKFRRPPLLDSTSTPVEFVQNVQVLPGDFLNRQMISKNYDYMQVAVKVTTIEQGS